MGERDRDLDYLNLAQVAIVALDHEGRVVRINRKGCEILRHEHAGVVGKDWFESFVPERLRDDLADVHRRLMNGDVAPVEYFENPVVTRDGEERLVAWHNTVLRDPDGRIVGTLSSGEDITERKRAEQELADIRHALDQAAIVAITDGRGTIRYANDKFCEISQYSREELIGQDHRILNSGYHPKEFIRNLWRTISGGKVWRGEIRNRAKDGSIYWVDTTIVPFTDERGKPYQYLAIRSDITDRKKAEEELRKREALARVGQMAAVVAHEVKNPLAGIGGAIEIIGSRLPSDSPDRQVVANILQRIDALNRRVQDLLLFSRPRAPRIASVRLPALLHETAELLAEDPTLARVKVEITGPELSFAGDPEQLKDVFLNLLLNAAQAMGGTGCIHVSAEVGNGACRIKVEDSGTGISPDVRGKIFEPFFTTKNRGTGLGLAIARQIVEGHGGKIGVRSATGEGTTITVSLPLGGDPSSPPVGRRRR
jgi:PAS domain S-box-containing protein